ncbi:MAG: hypothetical protein NZ561_11200, partial [Phycisphaerae bacterium]|nr:hypothetical protein [Phycisphaerae bacterium]
MTVEKDQEGDIPEFPDPGSAPDPTGGNPPSDKKFQRYRLVLAYRGTRYHGWQSQLTPPTWKGPLADDVPLKPTTHYGYFKCCNEGNARIYY